MGGYLSAYRQKLKHGRLELKSVCGCIVIQQQNLFLISVGHCSHPLFLISDGHCYNLLSSICAALGFFSRLTILSWLIQWRLLWETFGKLGKYDNIFTGTKELLQTGTGELVNVATAL